MELKKLIEIEANKLIKGVYSFDEKIEILLSANISNISMNKTNFSVWGTDRWYNTIKIVLSNVSFDLTNKKLIGNRSRDFLYNEYSADYDEMHKIRQYTIERYVDRAFIALMQQVDNSKVASYVTLITETFLDKLKKEKDIAIEKTSIIDEELNLVNDKISELKELLLKAEKRKEVLLSAQNSLSFDNIVKENSLKFCSPFDEANSSIINYFIINMMKLTGWFR